MSSVKQPQTFSGPRIASLLAELGQAIQLALLALNREISAYPPPIPACDAPFNFLLERRRRLSRDSRQIQRLMAQEAQEGVGRGELEALGDRLGRHDDLPMERLRAFLDEIRGNRQEDLG
jgi:hypothetical protein